MKVKFVPQNIELEIQPNQTVKDLADKNGIFIKSICNGLPSCAECRVRVVEGEHNVLPPGTKELSLIGSGHFIDQRRLSCQLICFGDITVDLTEQVDKKNKLTERRPQGSRKTEMEVSHAVTGNLLEQDSALKELVESQQKQSESEPAKSQPQARGHGNQPRHRNDNRHHQQRRSNQNRQGQNRPHQGRQQGHGSSANKKGR